MIISVPGGILLIALDVLTNKQQLKGNTFCILCVPL